MKESLGVMNHNEFKEYKSKLYHDITNEYDVFFAFGEKQLINELEKRQLSIKGITSIGYGGYIPSKNCNMYEQKMLELDNINKKWVEELKKHPTLLKNAIKYELGNYEYCVSYDSDILLSSDFRVYQLQIETFDGEWESYPIWFESREDATIYFN